MSYKIKTIPSFDRDAKRLHKRYKLLAEDLRRLVSELKERPLSGVDLGGGVHKIRLAIKSKGSGKRGGARIITYADVLLQKKEGTVYLLAMYDKAEQESISMKTIRMLLSSVMEE